MQQHKITQQNDWNTWKFSADHITDVCYAVSKNYVWDAASVVVDAKKNRRASVQAAYNDTAKDFHHSCKMGAEFFKIFFNTMAGSAISVFKDDCIPGIC